MENTGKIYKIEPWSPIGGDRVGYVITRNERDGYISKISPVYATKEIALSSILWNKFPEELKDYS